MVLRPWKDAENYIFARHHRTWDSHYIYFYCAFISIYVYIILLYWCAAVALHDIISKNRNANNGFRHTYFRDGWADWSFSGSTPTHHLMDRFRPMYTATVVKRLCPETIKTRNKTPLSTIYTRQN